MSSDDLEWESPDDDFDGCEHGVGFSENCEACDDDPIGCIFPGKCLMPGEHLTSECHTAEMMEDYLAEQGADQREELRQREG